MRAPYLMRRSSGFYFRIRVPADLVDRVGSVELRRALGPMSFHSARALASETGSQIKGAFVMLREIDDLSERETANLIQDCFNDLKRKVDKPYVVRTNDPWSERREQQHLADEHSNRLLDQIDVGKFEQEVGSIVEDLSRRKRLMRKALPS